MEIAGEIVNERRGSANGAIAAQAGWLGASEIDPKEQKIQKI
jgi:hypothetical protein